MTVPATASAAPTVAPSTMRGILSWPTMYCASPGTSNWSGEL